MRPFSTLAAVVFALVALGHLVRLVCRWEVLINGIHLPLWVSTFGVIIPAGLAYLLWRESRRQ